MTEVQFHFNTPDRLGYACRLLRKAYRKGAGVAVTGPPDDLDALDRALWVLDDIDFVPHLRVREPALVPARQRRSPLWLVDSLDAALHLPVVVNLGDDPARGFESFERVIEIVGNDDASREAGRARWRHYASRGYVITRHDVRS